MPHKVSLSLSAHKTFSNFSNNLNIALQNRPCFFFLHFALFLFVTKKVGDLDFERYWENREEFDI